MTSYKNKFSRTGLKALYGSSTILAGLVAMHPNLALAQNECGPPVAGVVNCATPDPANFPNGIQYVTASDLAINAGSGIVVTRGGPANSDGIRLTGTGTAQLGVQLSAGATVNTNSVYGDGIVATSLGANSIGLRIDGNVNGNFGANPSPMQTTAGAFANGDSATTSTIAVTQGRTSTVTMNGADSIGLYSFQQGTGLSTMLVEGTVSTTGDRTMGVSNFIRNATSTSAANSVIREGASITVVGDESRGAYLLGFGSGNLVQVVQGSITATGVEAAGSAALTYGPTASVTVNHLVESSAVVRAEGLRSQAVGSSTEGLGATTTTVAGRVIGVGDSGAGIAVTAYDSANTSTQTVNVVGNASVTSTGSRTSAVFMLHGGTGSAVANVQGTSTVAATGQLSTGIYMFGPAAANVVTTAATSVSATGLAGIGIRAAVNGASSVTVGGIARGNGQSSSAVMARSEAGAANVLINAGAQVTGGWESSAAPYVDGGVSYTGTGVVIKSATGSTLVNNGSIAAYSDRAILDYGRLSAPGAALAVTNNNAISGYVSYANVAGNRFTNSATGAFYTRHFADTNGDSIQDSKRVALSNFGAPTSVFSNAGLVILGAVPTAATTDATGYYVPTTGRTGRALETSVYSLTKAGIVQAQFTNLGRFEHSGRIDLRGPAVGNTLVMTSNAAAGGTAGTGLFISNGGQLYLNAVVGAGLSDGGQTGSQADMLIVDSTRLGTGATQIFLGQAAGSLGAATPGNGIQLVEVRNKAASAADVFALGAPVAAGAFQYSLFQNGVGGDAADGNWYLRSNIADPETGEEFPNYRPVVAMVTAVPAMAQRLGMDLLGNYHDRQGEDYADWLPRTAAESGAPSNGHSGNKVAMWARVLGSDGKVGYRRNSVTQQGNGFARYGSAYDYETLGFQLGFDLLRSTNATGSRSVAGLYGAIGEIEATVDGIYGGGAGRVQLDGYSAGVYINHKTASGAYIDAVAQGTRYKSQGWDYTGYQSRTKGWGYAGSLEVGLPLGMSGGWRLEPQAQIVYQRVKLDDTADALALYDYQNSNALTGRLGLRLANQWTRQSGLSSMIWARFNAWHDFDRKAEVRVSNLGGQNVTPLFSSLGGTWGQGQLALSSEVARNVSAFVSGDYSFSLDKMKSNAYGGRFGLKFVW